MEKSETVFQKAIEVLSSRMLSALGGYYIWKWMEQARNTNNLGGLDKANRNLNIFNRHLAFFGQIIKSTYKSFVIDLAFFFDKEGYENSLSINKLLDLGRDKFSDDDITEIKKQIFEIKQKQGKNIALILELRTADVAHQELDSRSRHVLYENIEALFKAVQEILNMITMKYDRSEHWWNHVEKEVNRQMDWVMNNLEKGENVRIKEIENKYKVTLNNKP